MSDDNKLEIYTKISKVDSQLGLVLGWAIISKKNGEDYFDLENHHIPESTMLEAATDFMENSRIAKDMHHKSEVLEGSILFAFPLTTEIAKAFNLETKQTGLMIGMKPESDEILKKFKTGEYTGFSIGGKALEFENV